MAGFLLLRLYTPATAISQAQPPACELISLELEARYRRQHSVGEVERWNSTHTPGKVIERLVLSCKVRRERDMDMLWS